MDTCKGWSSSLNKLELASSLTRLVTLLDIQGEHRQQVRALQHALDSLQVTNEPLSQWLEHMPSVHIGKVQVKAVIETLQQQGIEAACQTLGLDVPSSLVDLTRLPGVGAKTASILYRQHGIDSLDSLKQKLSEHRLRKIAGFGPDRLRRMSRDVDVLIGRQHAWPVAVAWPSAMAIADELARLPGVYRAEISGALRRLVSMTAELEFVVAISDETGVHDWASARGGSVHSGQAVVRVGPQDDSIRAIIHLTTPEWFAPTWMRTTGDATHQRVVAGLLERSGFHWDSQKIIGPNGSDVLPKTEEEIYGLVGLPYFPPELREGSGLLQQPATLVRREDIRGDLHVHSSWSDGSMSIAEVVAQAERFGYKYIAITDHSQSLTIAHGLTPDDIRKQRGEIEQVRKRCQIHVLHGSEVDILADGQLDLQDDILGELDLVVASVHSAMHQSRSDMTARVLKAIEHPSVDILGHMNGRMIGRRSGYELDTTRILERAAELGVMVEINANPNRLDMWDDLIREAVSLGIHVPIDTDTHHAHEFENIQFGVRMGIRGWLPAEMVPNTWPIERLCAFLKSHRK